MLAPLRIRDITSLSSRIVYVILCSTYETVCDIVKDMMILYL